MDFHLHSTPIQYQYSSREGERRAKIRSGMTSFGVDGSGCFSSGSVGGRRERGGGGVSTAVWLPWATRHSKTISGEAVGDHASILGARGTQLVTQPTAKLPARIPPIHVFFFHPVTYPVAPLFPRHRHRTSNLTLPLPL
jgi:hypothetical protein